MSNRERRRGPIRDVGSSLKAGDAEWQIGRDSPRDSAGGKVPERVVRDGARNTRRPSRAEAAAITGAIVGTLALVTKRERSFLLLLSGIPHEKWTGG